jgi:hypothetical protein
LLGHVAKKAAALLVQSARFDEIAEARGHGAGGCVFARERMIWVRGEMKGRKLGCMYRVS